MVLTLYSYNPNSADTELVNGIREVVCAQDDGTAQAARAAATVAAVQAAGHAIPDNYFGAADESVLGLPTGGPLDTADDVRIFARDEVTQVVTP